VKQQEIADLKRRQQRFREDPEFVERIARQNRRVRPGEIIFVGELPAPK
jgi:cell division protein FtsB